MNRATSTTLLLDDDDDVLDINAEVIAHIENGAVERWLRNIARVLPYVTPEVNDCMNIIGIVSVWSGLRCNIAEPTIY
jgi:hypothetical protein